MISQHSSLFLLFFIKYYFLCTHTGENSLGRDEDSLAEVIHRKSEEKGYSIFPKKIRYISYLDNNSIKIKLKGGLKIEQIDFKFFYILITPDRYIS